MNIKHLRLLSLLLITALATNNLHTTPSAADASTEDSALGTLNTHLKTHRHTYAAGLGAVGLLNLAYLFKSGKLSKAKLKRLFKKENRAVTTQLILGSLLPFILAGGVEFNGYGYAKEQTSPKQDPSITVHAQESNTNDTGGSEGDAVSATSNMLPLSSPLPLTSKIQNTSNEAVEETDDAEDNESDTEDNESDPASATSNMPATEPAAETRGRVPRVAQSTEIVTEETEKAAARHGEDASAEASSPTIEERMAHTEEFAKRLDTCTEVAEIDEQALYLIETATIKGCFDSTVHNHEIKDWLKNIFNPIHNRMLRKWSELKEKEAGDSLQKKIETLSQLSKSLQREKELTTSQIALKWAATKKLAVDSLILNLKAEPGKLEAIAREIKDNAGTVVEQLPHNPIAFPLVANWLGNPDYGGDSDFPISDIDHAVEFLQDLLTLAQGHDTTRHSFEKESSPRNRTFNFFNEIQIREERPNWQQELLKHPILQKIDKLIKAGFQWNGEAFVIQNPA